MLLDVLAGRQVIAVGGKGGVGKTTIASMLAVALAARGDRVRLVSTDPAHNLGHIFGRQVGDAAVEVAPGLTATEIDPGQAVDAHLERTAAHLKRLMPPASHGEVERHMARSRHAPGMAEAALLDRLADLVEGTGRDADRLVVDTAPTGHTLALLSLPEMMAAWTEGLLQNRVEADRFAARARSLTGADEPSGRDDEIRRILMRRRARLTGLRDALTDPGRTAFVIALTAERMPVLETLNLARTLADAGIEVPAIVVNRLRDRRASGRGAARLAPLTEALPDRPLFALDEQADEPQGLAALAALHDGAGRLAVRTPAA